MRWLKILLVYPKNVNRNRIEIKDNTNDESDGNDDNSGIGKYSLRQEQSAASRTF